MLPDPGSDFFPVDTGSRAMIHGVLNDVGLGAALVDDDGISGLIVQLKDSGAEFNADPAADAFGIDDIGHPHSFLHALFSSVRALFFPQTKVRISSANAFRPF